MVLDNSSAYTQNWAKPWSICIIGAVSVPTIKNIHGYAFHCHETQNVYFRKDYASYRSAERWAHYYEKKITTEYGEVLLRETHIHGPGTEAWW